MSWHILSMVNLLRRTALLSCLSAWSLFGALAQDAELTAYEPPVDEEFHMDGQAIGIAGRTADGAVLLNLPVGTRCVDLLNGRGRVVRSFTGISMRQLDLRDLGTGTYMLRAHLNGHIERKRIVITRPGRNLWTVDADTP
jgi:hypothetical protein